MPDRSSANQQHEPITESSHRCHHRSCRAAPVWVVGASPLRRYRLDEVLAEGCLHEILFPGHGGGEIGFQNLLHLGVDLAQIQLGILLLCPEADYDHFLHLLLRQEGQDLQEASLFLQNREDLILDYFDELVLLLKFRNELQNACKHREFSFLLLNWVRLLLNWVRDLSGLSEESRS